MVCKGSQYTVISADYFIFSFFLFQFGDVGLQLISDNLQNLEELNLCETYVTDKGISAISG